MTGPDTFRMELVEDPRIPAPVVSHHLHYWLEQPVEVKKFYVQKLLLKPTMRGPYESADLPGMNLTLAPLGSQKVPGVPMKGRLMDSIGFDVTNLKAYVDKIASNGVKFDVPYGRDAELGLMSATLTDPWGATIRLTKGSTEAGVTPYGYVDGYVVVRPISDAELLRFRCHARLHDISRAAIRGSPDVFCRRRLDFEAGATFASGPFQILAAP